MSISKTAIHMFVQAWLICKMLKIDLNWKCCMYFLLMAKLELKYHNWMNPSALKSNFTSSNQPLNLVIFKDLYYFSPPKGYLHCCQHSVNTLHLAKYKPFASCHANPLRQCEIYPHKSVKGLPQGSTIKKQKQISNK